MSSNQLSGGDTQIRFLTRAVAVLVAAASLGWVYLQQQRTAEFYAVFDICKIPGPDSYAAIAACDDVIAQWPLNDEDLALMYRNRSRAYIALKDWPNALRDAEAGTRIDPAGHASWSLKGFVLANLKDYPAALEATDRALEASPEDEYAQKQKAKLLRIMKRFDEMAVYMSDLAAIHTEKIWVLNYLGFAQLQIKENRLAALTYRKLLRRIPKDTYLREMFLLACRYAGPECPPLFPEKRASYPQLSCGDAIDEWGRLHPRFVDNILSATGHSSLAEYFEDANPLARVLFQATYLGTAAGFEQGKAATYARSMILEDRIFNCAFGGEFQFLDGQSETEESNFQKEHLFGPELRRNLVDLAYTHVN